MCTVTFIPAGDTIFIAHSRDEKSLRAKAITPAAYRVNGYTLLFPRDTQAGGAWIAVNANGAAAVLLNGAFVKHAGGLSYRKSRGLVLLDIVASGDSLLSWQSIDLENIEPFTVVLWCNGQLYEGRWDGSRKHTGIPDKLHAHTWSSVTLYDDDVISRRRQWFASWRQQCPQPTLDDVLQYHLLAGDGDPCHNLRMNRNNRMLTVSITGIALSAGQCRMEYLDLLSNMVYSHQLLFTQHMLLHT